MSANNQAEEAIIPTAETDEQQKEEENSVLSLKTFLWHGGSVYDAWFSCASNQVAQVLLTLPYSFSQMGLLSGIILQIFYGIMGSWTAYLISVLYVEYRSRKEKEGVNFKNHVIQNPTVMAVNMMMLAVYNPCFHVLYIPSMFYTFSIFFYLFFSSIFFFNFFGQAN